MLLLQSIWQGKLSMGLFLNLQGSQCMQHQLSPRRASLQLNKQDSRWWHTPSWGQGWPLKGTSDAWTILPTHPTHTLGLHRHKIRDYIWHGILSSLIHETYIWCFKDCTAAPQRYPRVSQQLNTTATHSVFTRVWEWNKVKICSLFSLRLNLKKRPKAFIIFVEIRSSSFKRVMS